MYIVYCYAVTFQVLPDVSEWDYKGEDKVRNQHCNLWELKQRCVTILQIFSGMHQLHLFLCLCAM